jgi:GDP-L-fucose synthase
MSKILILGSEGLLGKNLCQHLKLIKNYRFYKLSLSLGHDLRKQGIIENFLRKKKIEIIINLAGHTGGIHYFKNNYINVYLDNLLINTNIINTLKNIKKKITIINIIPNCLYDPSFNLQQEEKILIGNPHNSVSCYANPKKTLLSFTNKFKKVRFINLVFGGVFGPGDSYSPDKSHAFNAIIYRMKKAMLSSYSPFEVWGTGKPIREWIYIDDVSRVIIKTLGHLEKLENKTVNITSGICLSIKDLTYEIKKSMNYLGRITFNKKYQDGSLKKIMNNRKFYKYFKGFKFTPFKISLKKTLEHYLIVKPR